MGGLLGKGGKRYLKQPIHVAPKAGQSSLNLPKYLLNLRCSIGRWIVSDLDEIRRSR